jgi:hypothetical protein
MKNIPLAIFSLCLCSGFFTILPAQDSAQTSPGRAVLHSSASKAGPADSTMVSHGAVNPANIKSVSHYPVHAITGNDMTVAILASINPTIDGRPLSPGDEIAAFTPDGECLWSAKWKGPGKNIVLNIWGADPQNPKLGGMKIGDSMQYRVWDSTHGREARATVTYNTTAIRSATGKFMFHPTSGATYVINGISALASFTATSTPPLPIRLLSPKDSGTVPSDGAAFLWTRGPTGIDRYIVEAGGDSALASVIFSDTLLDTAAVCGTSLPSGATCWWHVKGHSGEGWNNATPVNRFRVAP